MIRLGIIGAGPNAAGHARYFHAATDRAKVVAIADPDLGRARTLAGECGGASAVEDYRAFLPDVDAVVVSSPNFLHKEHALAAAHASKHLFCEKPLGLTGTDAAEIAAAVKAAGVKSMVGFSVRLDPMVRTLHKMHQDGKFGTLRSVWSRRLYYMDPSRRAPWRNDANLSGGVLLEVNVHELDWMMMVGGPVRSVYAHTAAQTDTSSRANDHIWFMLNFANGAVGPHEGSWLCPTPAFIRGAWGDAGGAQTDEWGTKLMFARTGDNRADVPAVDRLDLRANFLDCIDRGGSPECDAAWTAKVMRVADAIHRSSMSGQVAKVDD